MESSVGGENSIPWKTLLCIPSLLDLISGWHLSLWQVSSQRYTTSPSALTLQTSCLGPVLHHALPFKDNNKFKLQEYLFTS